MAAEKAKTARDVCKEELLLCIDETNEALGELNENRLKTVNVKPIRKTYLKLLDTLDEKIEELTKQENSESDKESRKQEIKIQIERKVKDIDNQIMNHHDRVCPAELSRGAKERLYNELDKDVKEPIERWSRSCTWILSVLLVMLMRKLS